MTKVQNFEFTWQKQWFPYSGNAVCPVIGVRYTLQLSSMEPWRPKEAVFDCV